MRVLEGARRGAKRNKTVSGIDVQKNKANAERGGQHLMETFHWGKDLGQGGVPAPGLCFLVNHSCGERGFGMGNPVWNRPFFSQTSLQEPGCARYSIRQVEEVSLPGSGLVSQIKAQASLGTWTDFLLHFASIPLHQNQFVAVQSF